MTRNVSFRSFLSTFPQVCLQQHTPKQTTLDFAVHWPVAIKEMAVPRRAIRFESLDELALRNDLPSKPFIPSGEIGCEVSGLVESPSSSKEFRLNGREDDGIPVILDANDSRLARCHGGIENAVIEDSEKSTRRTNTGDRLEAFDLLGECV